MDTYGVTLLSGGLDSTTVATYAKTKVNHMSAITFDYGQSHSKEVICAKQIADIMSLEHKIIDISFLTEIAWYSALTNPELFPVPDSGQEGLQGHGIPITYVPLRNTIFVSLAASYLESTILHAIESNGRNPNQISAAVYLAPNAIDYSGYPDCRPEYFLQMQKTLEHGSKLWLEYGISISIETPIIKLSKKEIAQLGTKLNAPIEHTWSCYRAGDTPCTTCDSCVLRAKGFSEAKIVDPLFDRLGLQ